MRRNRKVRRTVAPAPVFPRNRRKPIPMNTELQDLLSALALWGVIGLIWLTVSGWN